VAEIDGVSEITYKSSVTLTATTAPAAAAAAAAAASSTTLSTLRRH